MGLFDQTRIAANLMKNMSPSQMKELMEQARESQNMMEQQISRIVQEEIQKRNLVSREELEAILVRKGL